MKDIPLLFNTMLRFFFKQHKLDKATYDQYVKRDNPNQFYDFLSDIEDQLSFKDYSDEEAIYIKQVVLNKIIRTNFSSFALFCDVFLYNQLIGEMDERILLTPTIWIVLTFFFKKKEEFLGIVFFI